MEKTVKLLRFFGNLDVSLPCNEFLKTKHEAIHVLKEKKNAVHEECEKWLILFSFDKITFNAHMVVAICCSLSWLIDS